MKRLRYSVVAWVIMVVTATAGAGAQSALPTAAQSLRNMRYCEVLPVVIREGRPVAEVYNTLGLNDCPPDAWAALDVEAIKAQFGAVAVQMNGPRYWVMDRIVGRGATQAGETVLIGGLGFIKRAEVVLTPEALESIPYLVREIERDTQYTYLAGQPIYELESPDGDIYVMQTYSQVIDASLSMEDLGALDTRLALPPGWVYRVVVRDQDLVLTAAGVAHLVQDDLNNSYQRVETTDLAPNGLETTS